MFSTSKRKIYNTRREKVIDFLIGFFGWFLLNGLLWIIATGLSLLPQFAGTLAPGSGQTITDIFTQIGAVLGIAITCLPLIINVFLLIFFAFRQYWIAIGGLSAFGAVLGLTICAGIALTAYCFYALNQGGP